MDTQMSENITLAREKKNKGKKTQFGPCSL